MIEPPTRPPPSPIMQRISREDVSNALKLLADVAADTQDLDDFNENINCSKTDEEEDSECPGFR